MRIAKLIFSFIFLVFVVLYIITSRNYITELSGADAQKIENKYVSAPINIEKNGEINISIDNKNWPYKKNLGNELLLVSLVFKWDDSSVPPEYYYKNKLIFGLKAYAKYNDTTLNRLVLTDYVTARNNIILKSEGQSGGGRGVENYNHGYPIGIINNFDFEKITINLNILQGDSILNKVSPRLVIESYKSSTEVAGYSWIGTFLLDVLLVISGIFLLVVIVLQLVQSKTRASSHT